MEALSTVEQETPATRSSRRSFRRSASGRKNGIDEHPAETSEQIPRQLTLAESDTLSDSGRSVFDDIDE